MTRELELRRDKSGWVFEEEPAGAAGAASLVLGDVRLSVQAADPSRLVELFVLADEDGTVAPSALSLVRALLGEEAAAALALLPSAGTGVPVADSAFLRAAAALAHQELAGLHLPRRPRLLDLPAVVQAHRLPLAHAGGLALDLALDVMPVATRLAAVTRRSPELLSRLTTDEVVAGALREHLLVVLAVLRAGRIGPGEPPTAGLVQALANALRPASADLGRQSDVDDAFAALVDQLQPRQLVGLEPVASTPVTAMPTSDEWPLSSTVEDSAAALGGVYALLVDGPVHTRPAAQEGWDVQVLMAPDTTEDDARLVEAVCTAPDGTELARVPFSAAAWPLAQAHVILPPGTRASWLHLRAAGASGSVDQDQIVLARTARSTARAAVSASVAGQHAAAADLWRRSATALALLPGRGRQVEQARRSAVDQERRAGAGPAAGDWTSRLLTVFDQWAAEALAGLPSAGEDRVDPLRRIVGDLEELHPSSAVLAAATEQLGRTLRDAPELQQDPDEARAVLLQAVQLHFRGGDGDAARRLLADA